MQPQLTPRRALLILLTLNVLVWQLAAWTMRWWGLPYFAFDDFPRSLLAESWGTDASHLYREWDFDGGTYVHAGDRIDHEPYYLAPDALVAWQVKRRVTFQRRAIASFHAPHVTVHDTGTANPAVVFSIESPSGEKQYAPRVWADHRQGPRPADRPVW